LAAIHGRPPKVDKRIAGTENKRNLRNPNNSFTIEKEAKYGVSEARWAGHKQGVGVGGRLLLAFLVISGFAVLGAGAAMFSFREIGHVVGRITLQRVPAALGSQDMSRRAERIVAAAPALLAAETKEEHAERSRTIGSEMDALSALMSDLEKRGVDNIALGSMRVAALRTNLDALDKLVAERIILRQQKRSLLQNALAVHEATQNLLTPWLQISNAAIAQAQRVVNNTALGPEERAAAGSRLERANTTLRSLQRVQLLATSVSDMLQQIATAEDENRVRVSAFRIQQAFREINQLAVGFDPKLQPLLAARFEQFREFVEGPEALPELRLRELSTLTQAARNLSDNAALSRDLTDAVDKVLEAANRDISQANEDVRATQQLSSFLIVWLYVGRNIVARLTKVSEAMLALAGGRRDVAVAATGNDELEAMGRAVEVLRRNAIELDELLIERAEAANRLEKVVEERTAELQRRGAVLHVTFDNMPQGVVMFDDDLRMVSWNRQFQEMLDLPDSLLNENTRYGDLIRFLAERGEYGDLDIEQKVLDNVKRARMRYTFERTRPDGTALEIRHNPVPGGGFVSIYSDMTERIRYEEALTAARDQAEAMSRTKSSFLANMSHELRTPLNAIIGLTEMLVENAARFGTDKAAEPLRRVLRAGRHLLALINDILDLAKVEAGKMELSIGTVAVGPLIDEVVGTARPLAEQNRNRLVVDLQSPETPVWADPIRLRQVLLNLLSNACKFTTDGDISLRIRQTEDASGPWLEIAVSDTGIGMTPEQVKNLFQEFAQGEASTARQFGGTGLGLAISRRLCRLMGGDIAVESEPGRGSTFTVRLPREAAHEMAGTDESDTTPVPHGSENLVLVIDDDPTARELLGHHLRADGFAVAFAANGVEGLHRAHELRPAVITLDILLPDLDGWTVLAALKGDPELAATPIIAVTIVDEKQRALTLGASDYLTKPIEPSHLTAALRRWRLPGRRTRVLVVEDDPDQRALVAAALSGPEWLLEEAANGKEALQRVHTQIPDIILLDLMLPEMDGFEVIAALQTNAAWRHIPVLVVTALDLTEADRRRLNLGIERMLSKATLTSRDLVARIRALLPSSGTGEATQRRMVS
jgi:signal transduction histidine kinase/DNA-binding response OmpR family regulator